MVRYVDWNQRVIGNKEIVDEEWYRSKKGEKRGNDEEKSPFPICLENGDALYQGNNGKNKKYGYRNFCPSPCKKANDQEKWGNIPGIPGNQVPDPAPDQNSNKKRDKKVVFRACCPEDE